MHYGIMVLELINLLVFKTGLTFGFRVVYSVMSQNCGSVSPPIMLNRSVPLCLRPYSLQLDNTSSFVFDIKANNDVGIYVMETPESSHALNYYRFYIGSQANTKIELGDMRNGIWSSYDELFGSYLDPSLFKSFWFSWKNGEIQVGQGDIVGQTTLMTWTDPNPFSVRGIGIGTCWGGTGEWKLKVEVEDESSGHFSQCLRSNLRSELPIIANYSTSKLSCAGTCANMDSCFGFNYEESSSRCELLSFGYEPVTSINPRELNGWEFYAKCYDENTVCVGCLL